MNIAFICCPENPVPPVGYGGAERVADIFCNVLTSMGHNVTLYCNPESTCNVYKKIVSPSASMSCEPLFLEYFSKHVDDYDFAIDYSAFHLIGQYFPKKCVSLMGGDAYKKYPHDTVHNKVYNSKEFAAFNGSSDWIHGPIEMYPDKTKFIEKPLNYFLYVGIVHPMKGLHIAAQACKELGKEFLVYGPIRDEAYWNTFKNDVTYCGLLGNINRDDVFGNAIAFLHPTRVCDANPTAPQEAMYRGTPVIACPNGGIVSHIQEGITGYFAENVENYVDKIKIVDKIDRKLVRQSILDQTDPVGCTRELLDFVNLKIFKKDVI